MNCEQAFAIVRLDTFLEVEFASRPEAIAVEKVVWTREGAESEVLKATAKGAAVRRLPRAPHLTLRR
jgi:hypothetical protein